MFDDGELLVVPAPQSRHSPDYELMMLDNHGYGPGYRHPTNQYRGQRSNHGYVVSSENRSGVIILIWKFSWEHGRSRGGSIFIL